MANPRSLILVTVDCLRADHCGFLGYQRPTTPFLDSLASESVVFQNAIVAGAPTYYSFPAIMASRHPLALGRDIIGVSPDEPNLASTLQESGYATAAFIAGNPYLSDRFGYNSGFEIFRDYLEDDTAPLSEKVPPRSFGTKSRLNHSLAKLCHNLGPAGSIYDNLYFEYCQKRTTPSVSFEALQRFPSADRIVDDATTWLSSVSDRPFFLWLHLMDTHSPYYPRYEALALMGDEDLNASRAQYLNSYWNRSDAAAFYKYREEVIKLYDAGVRWVDSQIARLIGTLQTREHLRECVFAFTADHGEEFLDHGDRYHAPIKLTEELIHVPLLLHAPNLRSSHRVATPFSTLHIAPTLLDAINVFPPAAFRGKSYWPRLKKKETWRDTAIAECISGCTNPFQTHDRMGSRILAVREEQHKLVLDFHSGDEQLFDLYLDPEERRPISDAKPIRQRLLEAARKHMRNSLQSRDIELRLSAQLKEIQIQMAPTMSVSRDEELQVEQSNSWVRSA